MPRKVIGILGGMGPEATADLFLKIIKSTPAKKDQEHLRILIDNNPQIPDRTAAILHGGEDPTPALVETGKNLERAGADFLIIPCNTAHYFHGNIQDAVTIPVLHMMSATAGEMKARGIKRAGLLASDGTVQSGLYHKALAQSGIEVVIPQELCLGRYTERIFNLSAAQTQS